MVLVDDGDLDVEQRLEPSHSTPNLGMRIPSRAPSFSMPMPLSIWAPTRDEYLNTAGVPLPSPMSPRSSSYSSSAEEAVQGDLPSPLEHISQEAAAYRSRVSSASRGVTRTQLGEVMRRIDLLQSRRVSEPASSAMFDLEGALISPTFQAKGPVHGNFSSSSQEIVPAAMNVAPLVQADHPFAPTTRHRRSLPRMRRVSEMPDLPPAIASRSKLFCPFLIPHNIANMLCQSHHMVFVQESTSITDLVT
jgi:hypothetical protein